MESNKNTIICTRGESRNLKKFITNKIFKKVFIVGEKARTHSEKEEVLQKYYHTSTDNGSLKKDIKELVSEINDNTYIS